MLYVGYSQKKSHRKTLGSKDDADEFTNDFRFYVNQHALSRIYMTNESRFAWRLNFREESLQQSFFFLIDYSGMRYDRMIWGQHCL
jgi:hypothetical protein